MKDRNRSLVAATALAAALGLAAPHGALAQEAEEAGPRTVEIEMVDFAFQPAEVTVRVGDTIRFVQSSASPHNVEFRSAPEGAKLGEEYVVPVSEIGTRAATFPPPKMGPFLTQEGQTYEFVVTDAFAAGTYDYVCTPHEPMGMKGKLVVVQPPEMARGK